MEDKLKEIGTENGADSKTQEVVPVGYADDATIAAWKTQHKMKRIPEVWATDDDDQPHVTYFKQPDIEHLQLLANKAKKDQEVEAMQLLFNTLRIGGSEDVLNDYSMKLQCFDGLGKIFKKKESVVKKR
jgi:hypothetical protein